jgi:hypothetical protein
VQLQIESVDNQLTGYCPAICIAKFPSGHEYISYYISNHLPTRAEEMMQAFSALVTLAPVHDFIFKKQTLALDIDPSADNAS